MDSPSADVAVGGDAGGEMQAVVRSARAAVRERATESRVHMAGSGRCEKRRRMLPV
jgi:hypothetical protein